MIPKLC